MAIKKSNKVNNNKRKMKPSQMSFNNPQQRAIQGGGFAFRMPKATQSIRTLPTGSVLVKDNELWYTVNGFTPGNVQTKGFQPGASGLVRLDQIASMFELWRIKKCLIHYYTNTGFNQNGMIHLGIDFDAQDVPTTVEGVSLLRPGFRGPVYMEHETINIDVDRVNRARWMYTRGLANHLDTSIGFLVASAATYASLTTPVPVGEVYCEYEIEFSSPTSPSEVLNTRLESIGIIGSIGVAGALTDTSVESISSYVNDVSSQAPAITSWVLSNPTGFTTAHWLDILTQITGVPNSIYQIVYDVYTSTNAPNISPVYSNNLFGTPLEIAAATDSETYGSASTAVAQVLTDNSGRFKGTLPVSCDHFPGSSASDIFVKIMVCSMGYSRVLSSYYTHTE